MTMHSKRPSLLSRGPLVAVLALALVGVAAPSASADDLDRMSGTSHWRDRGRLHAKAEWLEWYKARVAWRKARHELRLEAARNRHLAKLLRRGRPKLRDVRRIMRARLRRTRRRRAERRDPPRKRRPVRAAPQRRDVDEDEDEERDELETRGSRRRRLPEYKVKPEKLDKDGQAIDDEGDEVLRRSKKR